MDYIFKKNEIKAHAIYLLLQCTVKDEDKQTMQGIKGCEEVGHECTVFTDEEEAKDPC